MLYAQEKTFYLEEWYVIAGEQAEAIDRLVSIADDVPKGIAFDDSGNVYVAGYTTTATGRDFLAIKYNSSGAKQWVTQLDGAAGQDDEARAVAVDENGDVVAAGYATQNGSRDYYTAILNSSDGSATWEATFNGLANKDDEASQVKVDGQGNITVLGKNQTEEPEATAYTVVRYVKKDILLPPDEEAASTAISFIENRGQLTDSSGAAVEEVRFYNTSAFPATYFHHGRISFVTAAIDTTAETTDTLHRVDMTFKNGKNDARVFGLSQRDAYHNYYLGHIPEGRARVGLYERTVQTDIYNKIDLVAYSNNAGIKYYFVVKPGGDPEDIQLDFDGQSGLAATETGGVEIETSVGKFELPPPKAYQVSAEGEQVEVEWHPEYEIEGDTLVRFAEIGEYEEEKHLVIEVGRPEVPYFPGNNNWVTYFGAEDDLSSDQITSLFLDENDNLFICGYTFTSNFPEVEGQLIQVTGTGEYLSAYAAKFNEEAVLQYLSIFGGNDREIAYDLVADGNAVYVVGISSSTDFPVTSGSTASGPNDLNGMVVRLNELDGAFELARLHGDTKSNRFFSIDALNEKILIVGETEGGGSFPNTVFGSSYNQDHANAVDGLIVQIDENLEIIWSSHFGGKEDDSIQEIVFDQVSGIFYIVGNTLTKSYFSQQNVTPTDNLGFPNFLPPGADQFAFGNGTGNNNKLADIFIAEFNHQNQLVWTTFFGGEQDDKFSLAGESNIAINYQGQGELSVIAGTNDFSSFPDNPGSGYSQDGKNKLFVATFQSRQLSWLSAFGCFESQTTIPFQNLGEAAFYDEDGNLFILGSTDCLPVNPNEYCVEPSSNEFPICPPNGQGIFFQGSTNSPIYQGGTDAFIAAFNSNRTLAYSTYFGGNGLDRVAAAAHSNGSGRVYFVGNTSSAQNFPLQFPSQPFNVYKQGQIADNQDGFIARLPYGDFITSTEEENQNKIFNAYPNPANSILFLEFSPLKERHDLKMFNSLGQLVQELSLEKGQSETTIDLSRLPSGIFNIVIASQTLTLIKY